MCDGSHFPGMFVSQKSIETRGDDDIEYDERKRIKNTQKIRDRQQQSEILVKGKSHNCDVIQDWFFHLSNYVKYFQ